MEQKRPIRETRSGLAALVLALLVAAAAALYLAEIEYAYVPPADSVVSAPRLPAPAYDVWGESIGPAEAARLRASGEARARLAPASGAVRIDEAVLRRGRDAFYAETYGSEVFLTDVLGMLDGPFDRWALATALVALGGRGTDNLRVPLSSAAVVGGRRFEAGEKIDTGLDVPRGAFVPLGIGLRYARGRIRAGVSCALCHSTVDPETFQVIEGAPNVDLRVGTIMALAVNSTAYYQNTNAHPLRFGAEPPGTLPRAEPLERAVDRALLNWPPGYFDSTIDLDANPTQIPDSFTFGEHPYGWNGFASGGPFNGLSALGNNVHAQNADSTALTHVSPAAFDMPADLHLAIVLRNAAARRFRPGQNPDMDPAQILRAHTPTPWGPGLNELIRPPIYPRISTVVPDGVMISDPGHRVWELNNAMSAFQNTLAPPAPPLEVDARAAAAGREVFERAGCARCHGGPRLTNNRIVPVQEVGTEGSRAKAFAKLEPLYEPHPRIHSFDTPVPVPDGARTVDVPQNLPADQIALAMAFDNPGGYKVPGLIGLYYTPPYLHDGGVAVGPDPDEDLGVAGTLLEGIRPEPRNSLRALVDRRLRARVVAANAASGRLRAVHVTGAGHAFWVDRAAGYTAAQQQQLVSYLLRPDLAPPGR